MKARKVTGLDPAKPFAESCERIVRTRIEELRSFASAALDPAALDAQHDMRIAAKRLRYVLEVAEFCFGEPAVAACRSARELQDLLGEIHDCDVMLPRVEAQIEELREEEARALLRRAGDATDLDPRLVSEASRHPDEDGLERLALHLRARRALLHDRFRSSWQAEASRGTWARLESAVAQGTVGMNGAGGTSPAQKLQVALRETASKHSVR